MADLKLITSEPWLVWQLAIFSNRAKWRSPLSGCRGVPKKYLTTPAL